ncbi:hypothetical protein [Nocardioides antri]|uniref:Uncharacterized protein n=1 Tax=Nocardioides antri TaxID=2607659 RepID=A0A5B1MA31_9ACTN|nr:hypothetical protein [Nocardioides antri]KAA1428777.1 hypothetical protein F0U47_00720 [Nocardioides antri]
MDPLPVACDLTPDDGQERLRRWQRLVQLGRATAALQGELLAVRFHAEPGVKEELEALAAAERRCCSYLTWTVASQADSVTLLVTADSARPEDVAHIATLFGA